MKTNIRRLSASGSLCLAVAALSPSLAYAQDVQFDMDILKSRGLDTSLGNYFSQSAKFMPGRKPVTLIVNGADKGTVTARFGRDGELCVERSFLQSAGLAVPFALRSDTPDESVCYDYKKDYPSAVITPMPGEESLSMVVPAEALAATTAPDSVNHGGVAGLFNYSLMSSRSSYGGSKSRYDQVALEDGFNFDDWLLRSRQIMTATDDASSSQYLYTYVQHTFENIKTLMQAGEINISNSLFSGAAIDGIQFIPESGLLNDSGSGVTVSGIANSAQARVEVKQSGKLVYSTLVPAGPFTLNDVPIVSLTTALEVTVIETNGAQSHYTVSADTLRTRLPNPQGLSLSAGRLQDKGDRSSQPWVVSATDGWRIKPWLNVSMGGMTAQEYNALAGQFDILPLPGVTVSAALRASDDSYGDNTGHSSNLNVSYSATKNLMLSASATRYSSGYRELTDTLDDNFTQYAGQYSTSLSWSHPLAGSFSFGYSLNQGSEGTKDSRYLNASWGKGFKWASISVNWQRLLNPQEDNDHRDNAQYGDMVYVNVSIPVGTQRVSGYMHKNGDSVRNGLSTSGELGHESYYSVSAERDNNDGENSFSGSLNSNLHYTQLGLSAGKEGPDGQNSSLTLNGGVVAHSEGVSFSSYAVQDTFAIASVGEHVSGVELDTPAGPVWTDHWGRAVVPSLPEYKTTRVEMNTETLPKNIDVNNGISVFAASHGSVSDVNFSVLNVRRVMLNLTMANGHLVPKNGTLVDGEGNYVTTVVDEGLVYLNDADQVKGLQLVDDAGHSQCRIHYRLPEKRDGNVPYESVKGVCQ